MKIAKDIFARINMFSEKLPPSYYMREVDFNHGVYFERIALLDIIYLFKRFLEEQDHINMVLLEGLHRGKTFIDPFVPMNSPDIAICLGNSFLTHVYEERKHELLEQVLRALSKGGDKKFPTAQERHEILNWSLKNLTFPVSVLHRDFEIIHFQVEGFISFNHPFSEQGWSCMPHLYEHDCVGKSIVFDPFRNSYHSIENVALPDGSVFMAISLSHDKLDLDNFNLPYRSSTGVIYGKRIK